MTVLFFMARPGGGGEELLCSLSRLVPRESLESFFDLGSFSERIRRPGESASIAIIWNPAKEDLRRIGSMKDLLRGGRTLLALADQDKETVALAHNLLPAFISYVGDGISGLLSVLERLTGFAAGSPARGADS